MLSSSMYKTKSLNQNIPRVFSRCLINCTKCNNVTEKNCISHNYKSTFNVFLILALRIDYRFFKVAKLPLKMHSNWSSYIFLIKIDFLINLYSVTNISSIRKFAGGGKSCYHLHLFISIILINRRLFGFRIRL